MWTGFLLYRALYKEVNLCWPSRMSSSGSIFGLAPEPSIGLCLKWMLSFPYSRNIAAPTGKIMDYTEDQRPDAPIVPHPASLEIRKLRSAGVHSVHQVGERSVICFHMLPLLLHFCDGTSCAFHFYFSELPPFLFAIAAGSAICFIRSPRSNNLIIVYLKLR